MTFNTRTTICFAALCCLFLAPFLQPFFAIETFHINLSLHAFWSAAQVNSEDRTLVPEGCCRRLILDLSSRKTLFPFPERIDKDDDYNDDDDDDNDDNNDVARMYPFNHSDIFRKYLEVQSELEIIMDFPNVDDQVEYNFAIAGVLRTLAPIRGAPRSV